MKEEKSILLFDSDCLMCNGFIQFVLRHDQSKELYFASLNSEKGKKLTDKLELDTTQIDSAILIKPTKYYLYTDAVLMTLQMLGGVWTILGKLLFFVPKPWRDYLYRQLAKRRYIFGKNESCMLLPPELRKRFL